MQLARGHLFAVAALLGVAALGAWWAQCQGAPWSILVLPDASSLSSLFGSLLFIAAVVERATEVFVSGTRMKGAVEQKARAQLASGTERREQQVTELATHRAVTQRFAFGFSYLLGLLVSLAGVSCLGPLSSFEPGSKVPFLLRFVDVLLTSLVVAGGADGIHRILAPLFEFFERGRAFPGANEVGGAPAEAQGAAAIPTAAAAPIPKTPRAASATPHIHDPGA